MTKKSKTKAGHFGRFGETVGAAWLRLKGYRILERGARAGGVEVDLIAQRGSVIAFVEVKARRDLASAADAIRPQQRARIERAAAAFLAGRRDLDGKDIRFDAILVAPWAWPVHVADAWRPAR